MSAKTFNYVMEHSPYKATERVIHLILGDLANDQNDYKLWIAQKKVAEKARCHRQKVCETFAKFCDEGFLKLIEDNSRNDRPNVYQFLMPVGVRNADTTCPDNGHHVSAEQTPRVRNADTELKRTEDVTQENDSYVPSAQDSLFTTDETPTPPKASLTPPTYGSLPKKGRSRDFPVAFETVRAIYPKIGDVNKGYTAWRARRVDGVTEAELLTAAQNYAAHVKKERTDDHYIKMMQGFYSPDGPWETWLKRTIKTNWRDPQQNVGQDREGPGGIIDPKDLYRKRKEDDAGA